MKKQRKIIWCIGILFFLTSSAIQAHNVFQLFKEKEKIKPPTKQSIAPFTQKEPAQGQEETQSAENKAFYTVYIGIYDQLLLCNEIIGAYKKTWKPVEKDKTQAKKSLEQTYEALEEEIEKLAIQRKNLERDFQELQNSRNLHKEKDALLGDFYEQYELYIRYTQLPTVNYEQYCKATEEIEKTFIEIGNKINERNKEGL